MHTVDEQQKNSAGSLLSLKPPAHPYTHSRSLNELKLQKPSFFLAASPPWNSGSSQKITTTPEVNPDSKRRQLVGLIAALAAIPGYLQMGSRGTPTSIRKQTLGGKFSAAISPEDGFFPNNRASWSISLLNSGSLFTFGILYALKAGGSFAQAFLANAMLGMYAVGAGYLCMSAFRYGSAKPMSQTDKRCLVLGGTAVALAGYAALAQLGVVAGGHLPLEGVGIVLTLVARTIALYPLARELREALHRVETEPGVPGPRPCISAHAFWNFSSLVNLLSIPWPLTLGVLPPLAIALQNGVVGTRAYRLWKRLRGND